MFRWKYKYTFTLTIYTDTRTTSTLSKNTSDTLNWKPNASYIHDTPIHANIFTIEFSTYIFSQCRLTRTTSTFSTKHSRRTKLGTKRLVHHFQFGTCTTFDCTSNCFADIFCFRYIRFT